MHWAKALLSAAALACWGMGAGLHQAQAQTVNLVYANALARGHVQFGVVADEWIRQIEKATDGRVRIRHVAGGALLKLENMVEGLRGGVADMGVTNISNFPGQLPIAATLAGTADLRVGNKVDAIGLSLITLKLLEEFPEIEKEFADLNLRPLVWIPTYTFAVIARSPLATIADFQGKKIRAFGPNLPRILSAAGATPLSIAAGEVYTSLQTGVIDAAMTDPPQMISARLYEQAKNLITTGPGAGAQTLGIGVTYMINLDSWKKIPAADQETILQISREVTLAAGRRMQQTGDDAHKELQKKGVTIRHLSAEDTEQLAKQAPDFLKLAADRINEAGKPGDRIVQRARELADAYAAGTLKP